MRNIDSAIPDVLRLRPCAGNGIQEPQRGNVAGIQLTHHRTGKRRGRGITRGDETLIQGRGLLDAIGRLDRLHGLLDACRVQAYSAGVNPR